MPSITTDPHSLSAPYALDALEAHERTRYEAHLEECLTCRTELAGFQATAVRLGEAVSLTPPPVLRRRLLAEIARTPQERLHVTAIRPRRGPRAPWARLIVAAAVLVGIVGAGGFAVELDRAHDADSRTEAITAVLAAPDATTTSKTFSTGGNVRLVASPTQDAAVIVANDLARLKGGKVYQVWMANGAGPKSQGTFTTDGSMIMTGAAGADSVAITVEPEGGSPEPTTAAIVTIDL